MSAYTVWNQDVWGHCGDDCTQYGCPCVTNDVHDDDKCDCTFTVNDRAKVGTVEIPDGADDAATLAILDTDNFIHAHMCEIDDIGDPDQIYVVAKSNQRPLLQLEKVNAES